jgi:hypothetical protein
MKTYVIENGYSVDFYPPLTRDQKVELWTKHLFEPIRVRAKESNGELVVKEELTIIGRSIIEASEKAAKDLRSLGYHLQIKKTR